MKLSIIIPAYNEEMNIVPTLTALIKTLRQQALDFELIVVNDNCRDNTRERAEKIRVTAPEITLLDNPPPRGFGRAIRFGLKHATGDVLIPFMADLSDDPEDVVRYFRKIEEGYDCVFGSRFTPGSQVKNYPPMKLLVNRLVNRMLQVLFMTGHNDLTNAFKAYRAEVIRSIMPLQACHFNITIELSLSALIRKFRIASMPVRWNGRTWGSSNLHLRVMGRRYMATLLKIWFEKLLIMDDLMAEKEYRSIRHPETK